MNKDEAKKALEEAFKGSCIPEFDGEFHLSSPFTHWRYGDEEICLDGDFTLPQLKAIVAFMEAE